MAKYKIHGPQDAINYAPKRKVMVTGATGFLGGVLARDLIVRGFDVIGIGRNRDKGHSLIAFGADFRRLEPADSTAINEAMRGVDVVVHCGGLEAHWGRRKDFTLANVVGTNNVIDACINNSVQRLVHISTPCVVSRFAHQINLNESEPAPSSFVSEYARSKWIAEESVRGVDPNALETVILRPKALYGPGDSNLFPKIMDAALNGHLRIIGDGTALSNFTHIHDVIQSIRLAMDKPEAVGNTYFITGGEDLRTWDVLGDLLEGLDVPRTTRSLSISKAMKIGRSMEWTWRLCHKSGEPPLTRNLAGIFGFSQTLDISAARRDLGYRPRISVANGINGLIEWHEMDRRANSARA
ncbi:MAG: NAD-dependent epimerase/dehydratase family protein [Chloroflexi bacterium]|nr:NAD-dependent epimerase/dehydratase family protein [Chloroflexota bacterium]MDA1226486.1 NAD-dependent epimerase/dehydratase family protein [Chloroflexota bacterium]